MIGPFAVLAALLGLVIGSFVNVVVARLPAGRSLWGPHSACLACGTPIAWHDNIPLLSFALLRGRCRTCGVAISPRYPIIEAMTGGLFVLAYATLGLDSDLVIAFLLLPALVAITAIDLEHQIVPDKITLPGIVAGVIANVACQRVPWVDSIIGIVVGGGVFLVIILASGGGMGGGDMKLGAMLGAFLGWKIALLSILVAVIVGGAVAVAFLASGTKGRKEPIAFGPFLAGGGVVGLLWGERVITWYMSAFRV
ncbi:MAG TPA: prepilin peptidase [Methylomirabilota bacterium]|nr:prepilin peptidase [Methylomirabilota bacterium]